MKMTVRKNAAEDLVPHADDRAADVPRKSVETETRREFVMEATRTGLNIAFNIMLLIGLIWLTMAIAVAIGKETPHGEALVVIAVAAQCACAFLTADALHVRIKRDWTRSDAARYSGAVALLFILAVIGHASAILIWAQSERHLLKTGVMWPDISVMLFTIIYNMCFGFINFAEIIHTAF